MNKRDAAEFGRDRGYEAAIYCEVGPRDKREAGCGCADGKVCSDCLTEAAFEAEINAREYAGHIDDMQGASLAAWDAYDNGVARGIADGIKARQG